MQNLRSYYLWKWADNMLPGNPAEIVSAIYKGYEHPAISLFDPAPVLEILENLAKENQSQAGGMYFETDCSEHALFIHVSDRPSNKGWLDDKMLWAGWKGGLTLYEESNNRLHGLPKLNVLERPGRHQRIDIRVSEIPVLLEEMGTGEDSFAFYDRNGNMLQCSRVGNRFAVEWQTLPERDFSRHRIWVAGNRRAGSMRRRLGQLHLFANEILTITDAKLLWEWFMRSPERPDEFCWREITEELNNRAEGPNRMRYQMEKRNV